MVGASNFLAENFLHPVCDGVVAVSFCKRILQEHVVSQKVSVLFCTSCVYTYRWSGTKTCSEIIYTLGAAAQAYECKPCIPVHTSCISEYKCGAYHVRGKR